MYNLALGSRYKWNEVLMAFEAEILPPVCSNFVIKSFPSCFPKDFNKNLTEKCTCDKAESNTAGTSQSHV